MKLPKPKWIRRATYIGRILTRFGFASALHMVGLERFLPKLPEKEVDAAAAGLELPVRLRLAIEEIGATAIKLGQAVSSRSDLLPIEYIRELRKLQDEVPPFSFEEAKQIVEEELEGELEELFAEFDPEPAASASIGQVHYAVRHDGREVAVKVRRPGVAETVDTDLQILVWAAWQAERYSEWCKRNRIAELAQELAHSLRTELNYEMEARNTDLLRKSLADDERAVVPEVYWDLSARRVLTLEWMRGAKVSDDQKLEQMGVDRARAAANLGQLVLEQVLEEGFFHADPHAGNILISPDEKIIFLDCANATHIGRQMRETLVQVLLAVFDEDARGVCDQLIELGAVSEDTDLQNLYVDVETVLSRYGTLRSSSGVGIGELLDQMMSMILRHEIRMPPTFPMLIKTVVVTEGVCLQLDPDFDTQDAAQNIARQILRDMAHPLQIMEQLVRTARELQRHLLGLPRQLSQLLSKAQSGGLKVKFEYDEPERPMRSFAALIDRLAISIVVSAFILASAWLLASGAELPPAHGADVIVYVVGGIGTLLGGWLLVSIIRSGRM